MKKPTPPALPDAPDIAAHFQSLGGYATVKAFHGDIPAHVLWDAQRLYTRDKADPDLARYWADHYIRTAHKENISLSEDLKKYAAIQ